MSIRAGFCISQVPAPSAAPHGPDPAIQQAASLLGFKVSFQLTCSNSTPKWSRPGSGPPWEETWLQVAARPWVSHSFNLAGRIRRASRRR